MRQLTAEVRRFLTACEAATAIEYAIIAAGIAGAIIVTITALGSSVTALWTSVAAAFG